MQPPGAPGAPPPGGYPYGPPPGYPPAPQAYPQQQPYPQGAPQAAPYPYAPYPNQVANPYAPPVGMPLAPGAMPYAVMGPPRTHDRARLALILASLSWFTGLSLFLAIPALVIASGALSEIRSAPPGTFSNASEAEIAKWVSLVHIVLVGLAILAVGAVIVLAVGIGPLV